MMNKYKMAVSCGKGFGIVKTVEKTWPDIVTKLSKHIETNNTNTRHICCMTMCAIRNKRTPTAQI